MSRKSLSRLFGGDKKAAAYANVSDSEDGPSVVSLTGSVRSDDYIGDDGAVGASTRPSEPLELETIAEVGHAGRTRVSVTPQSRPRARTHSVVPRRQENVNTSTDQYWFEHCVWHCIRKFEAEFWEMRADHEQSERNDMREQGQWRCTSCNQIKSDTDDMYGCQACITEHTAQEEKRWKAMRDWQPPEEGDTSNLSPFEDHKVKAVALRCAACWKGADSAGRSCGVDGEAHKSLLVKAGTGDMEQSHRDVETAAVTKLALTSYTFPQMCVPADAYFTWSGASKDEVDSRMSVTMSMNERGATNVQRDAGTTRGRVERTIAHADDELDVVMKRFTIRIDTFFHIWAGSGHRECFTRVGFIAYRLMDLILNIDDDGSELCLAIALPQDSQTKDPKRIKRAVAALMQTFKSDMLAAVYASYFTFLALSEKQAGSDMAKDNLKGIVSLDKWTNLVLRANLDPFQVSEIEKVMFKRSTEDQGLRSCLRFDRFFLHWLALDLRASLVKEAGRDREHKMRVVSRSSASISESEQRTRRRDLVQSVSPDVNLRSDEARCWMLLQAHILAGLPLNVGPRAWALSVFDFFWLLFNGLTFGVPLIGYAMAKMHDEAEEACAGLLTFVMYVIFLILPALAMLGAGASLHDVGVVFLYWVFQHFIMLAAIKLRKNYGNKYLAEHKVDALVMESWNAKEHGDLLAALMITGYIGSTFVVGFFGTATVYAFVYELQFRTLTMSERWVVLLPIVLWCVVALSLAIAGTMYERSPRSFSLLFPKPVKVMANAHSPNVMTSVTNVYHLERMLAFRNEQHNFSLVSAVMERNANDRSYRTPHHVRRELEERKTCCTAMWCCDCISQPFGWLETCETCSKGNKCCEGCATLLVILQLVAISSVIIISLLFLFIGVLSGFQVVEQHIFARTIQMNPPIYPGSCVGRAAPSDYPFSCPYTCMTALFVRAPALPVAVDGSCANKLRRSDYDETAEGFFKREFMVYKKYHEVGRNRFSGPFDVFQSHQQVVSTPNVWADFWNRMSFTDDASTSRGLGLGLDSYAEFDFSMCNPRCCPSNPDSSGGCGFSEFVVPSLLRNINHTVTFGGSGNAINETTTNDLPEAAYFSCYTCTLPDGLGTIVRNPYLFSLIGTFSLTVSIVVWLMGISQPSVSAQLLRQVAMKTNDPDENRFLYMPLDEPGNVRAFLFLRKHLRDREARTIEAMSSLASFCMLVCIAFSLIVVIASITKSFGIAFFVAALLAAVFAIPLFVLLVRLKRENAAWRESHIDVLSRAKEEFTLNVDEHTRLLGPPGTHGNRDVLREGVRMEAMVRMYDVAIDQIKREPVIKILGIAIAGKVEENSRDLLQRSLAYGLAVVFTALVRVFGVFDKQEQGL